MTVTTPDGSGCEWGARGHGPHGQEAAREMVGHIQRWNQMAGPARKPSYSYQPYSAAAPQPQTGTAVLAKRHGTLIVHWPTDLRP